MRWQIYYGFRSGLTEQEWNRLTDAEQRARLYPKKEEPKPECASNLAERVRGTIAPSEMQIVEMDAETLARLPTFGGL